MRRPWVPFDGDYRQAVHQGQFLGEHGCEGVEVWDGRESSGLGRSRGTMESDLVYPRPDSRLCVEQVCKASCPLGIYKDGPRDEAVLAPKVPCPTDLRTLCQRVDIRAQMVDNTLPYFCRYFRSHVCILCRNRHYNGRTGSTAKKYSPATGIHVGVSHILATGAGI